MAIHIVDTLSKEKWHRFVQNNPAASIFHTPEMFEVFSRVKGYRPILRAALDSRGTVLALLTPVQITLKGGLLHRLTTRAVANGGVLCDPSPAGKEGLAALLDAYKRETGRKFLFTELRNLVDQGDLQLILTDYGFLYEDHLNYLIDLDRSPQEIFQSFGRRTRWIIRRGLRLGEVSVQEIKEQEQLTVFFNLLQKTYHRAQVPLADRSLFEALFDVLYPKNMVRFALARINEVTVAASVELLYKDIVYGWYGGMDRAYSRHNPNELLTWNILEWGTKNGYKIYDFGGAGRPDEEYGPQKFKAKFKGELVCYGRNMCVHAPLLFGLSKFGYDIYRRFC